jgi:hypothetical protein
MKAYAKIVKGLNKMVTKLDALADKRMGEVHKNNEVISALKAENNEKTEEASRANRTAARIKDLIG